MRLKAFACGDSNLPGGIGDYFAASERAFGPQNPDNAAGEGKIGPESGWNRSPSSHRTDGMLTEGTTTCHWRPPMPNRLVKVQPPCGGMKFGWHQRNLLGCRWRARDKCLGRLPTPSCPRTIWPRRDRV